MLEFVVGVFCVKHHLIMSVLCQTSSTACIGVRCGCSLLCMPCNLCIGCCNSSVLRALQSFPVCLQLFLLYESVSQTLPKEGVPYDVATCESMIASFEATQKQTRSATYECKEAILSLKERMQEATITAKRGGIILDYFKAGSFLEKKTAEIDKKLEEVEAVMSRRETLLNLILKMRNFELQARKVGVLSMPAFCLAVIRVTACVLHQ